MDKSLGFASDCGHIKRIIGRDYSELKKQTNPELNETFY